VGRVLQIKGGGSQSRAKKFSGKMSMEPGALGKKSEEKENTRAKNRGSSKNGSNILKDRWGSARSKTKRFVSSQDLW